VDSFQFAVGNRRSACEEAQEVKKQGRCQLAIANCQLTQNK
jgi:hypothetical protein